MTPVFEQIATLLREGKVNEKDVWLAKELLKDHRAGRTVSTASVTWLKSLVAREGGPFKG